MTHLEGLVCMHRMWWGIIVTSMRSVWSEGCRRVTFAFETCNCGAPCTSAADGCGRCFAQDIIAKLLTRDPAKRLGARAGAEEVKAHPFFCGINWALLRNTQPPFVPRADPTVPVPPPHAQAVFDEF